VTRHLIEDDQFLGVLRLCGPHKQILGLPSWVPDFSVLVDVGARRAGRIRKRGTKGKPAVGTSSNADELVLGGSQLVIVACVGMPILSSDSKGMLDGMKDALLDWDDMLKLLPSNPLDKFEALWRTIIRDTDRFGDAPPRRYAWYAATWFADIGLRHVGFPKDLVGEAADQDVSLYAEVMWNCLGKRLSITTNGDLCLAPAATEEGDSIVAFLGADALHVLRNHGTHYELVGETFVLQADGNTAIPEVENEDHLKFFNLR
jgi:hypothetical protein